LVLPATVPLGFWLFGILYFFLEVRPPAHCRASAHFFSEISHLMFARDLGRASSGHSTPRVSGSSAVSLAHLSACSFPSTPSCAGYHLISIVMPGAFLCSSAMCYLASNAYFCPGPGSSDDILLIATCASVKMVTWFGVRTRFVTVSSARASATHSAS